MESGKRSIKIMFENIGRKWEEHIKGLIKYYDDKNKLHKILKTMECQDELAIRRCYESIIN